MSNWNTRRVQKAQIVFEKIYSMDAFGASREMRVNLLTFGGERFSVSYKIGPDFDFNMMKNGMRADLAAKVAEAEALHHVCGAINKEIRANLHRENCITF